MLVKNGIQNTANSKRICCLKPQVKGLSDNIFVKSIVGRFLEISGEFCFSNWKHMPSSSAKFLFPSIDIMPRNFDRRHIM